MALITNDDAKDISNAKEIHKPFKKNLVAKKLFRHIEAKDVLNSVQMDLAEMTKLTKAKVTQKVTRKVSHKKNKKKSNKKQNNTSSKKKQQGRL